DRQPTIKRGGEHARRGRKMVKLVYGLMQSLDGYVSGPEEGPGLGAPNEELFRHFIEQLRGVGGCLYGRRIYEVMRYWDEDRPDYSDIEREFGEVWRSKPKWVASRTLKTVGPNASLIEGDLESFVVGLKKDLDDNHDDGSATEIE